MEYGKPEGTPKNATTRYQNDKVAMGDTFRTKIHVEKGEILHGLYIQGGDMQGNFMCSMSARVPGRDWKRDFITGIDPHAFMGDRFAFSGWDLLAEEAFDLEIVSGMQSAGDYVINIGAYVSKK